MGKDGFLMPKMPSAYNCSFYRKFGIDLTRLGCVSLNVAVPEYVSAQLDPEWAYCSDDPKLAHVNGYPTQHHVTLLFGLLANANRIKPEISEVLTGWDAPEVLPCVGAGFFPSPIPAEPYKCVWVQPSTGRLLEAHQRLSLLPHVNTHPTYEPHITLGYVHERYAASAVARLEHLVLEQQLSVSVLGLDYGDTESVVST